MNEIASKSKRNLILFNACITTFMATLDGSIVNITLPVISDYFKASINSVQWIVTAYLLTISAILLIWGKISDLYGRKYLFAAGIAIFTIGSLLCGVANSLPMLIFSRVLQAVGASITMALVQGIVTAIFPANERGKALGVVGTVVAVGSLVGPGLGGVLVHIAGWRSIFFINIPFGVAGVILTLILMNITHTEVKDKQFDFIGSIIFVFAIVLLFIGLLSMQDGIISMNSMLLMIAVAIVLFFIFIWYEKKQKNPLLDIKLFENSMFSVSLATAYISFVSMFAYIFFMPFYLQYALRMNILTAGLIMSVYPITTGILAPISGHLSDRKKHIPLTLIGLTINTVALALISLMNASSPIIQIVLLVMLLGIGSALFQSPNTSYIMGSVTRDKLGVAGSINAFFRNFGMVSGTTLSVMLFLAVTKMRINNIDGSTFNNTVFFKGFQIVLLSAAALSLFAVILTMFRNNKEKSYEQPKH